MAFNVNLYTFSKKENSTLRPSSSPTTLACVIKRGSGLISPKIELDLGLNTAPAWNYCYIPNFGRYYFISEWYNDKALWIANLTIDVLATYRTEIGSANLYALRSSASYDGRIVDTFYPTKTGSTFKRTNINNLWTVTGGVYVMGVVNKHPDFGSVKYYILNSSDFNDVVSYLLSDKLLTVNNFDPNDASLELQKSLIDPLQYIKSCTYIPIDSATVTAEYPYMATVVIFNWNMGDVGSLILKPYVNASKPRLSFSRIVNIPKHPQTTSRGNYTNTSPYTNIQLLIPPFGVIELDTSITCNAERITCEVEIDMPTGRGILNVLCNGIVLNRLEAQIGVPIQLSQVTRDYLGGAVATVNATAGVIGNALTGNVAGAITSGVNGVAEATRCMIPRSQTIGSGGAFAQLVAQPRIEAQFFELVDDDINHNGRPLCQMVSCSSNTGYYLIQDGDVAISGTKEEAQQIKTYLESGFYWE